MRKIISLLLVLFTVLPIISACGSGKDAATTTAPKHGINVEIPDTKVTENSDGSTRILYEANNENGGYINGRESQTLASGRTASAVTAVPLTGYKFLQWSDGSTDATRKEDAGTQGSTTTYYAVFAPEAYEMPMVFIDTETGEEVTSKEEYIGATISVANCAEEYVLDELDMEIRGRGNYSWELDKKSYRLKLSEQQKLLGVGDGKSKSWVLLANHCDQSLLRNSVVHAFAGMMSGIDYAPEFINVEVYLNGRYNGVYLLCEPISVNKNRVNINEDVESGTDIGYLIQMTEYAEDPKFRVDNETYEIKNDLSTKLSTAKSQQQYIQTYVTKCWKAVESGNQQEIEALIDIDSAVDTYLVEEFSKNLDVGWDSFYFHKDRGGKLVFGPIWDFDLALGNANEGCEEYTDLYVAQSGKDQSNPWYYTLMEQDWFRTKVAERWLSDEVQNLVKGLPDMVTSSAKESYKSLCRNFECWDIFGESINRETYYITSLSTYEEHYEYLAEWITNRAEWLTSFFASDEYKGGSNGNPIGENNGWPNRNEEPAAVDFTCSGGTGSKADPYLISAPKDFSSLTKAALSGNDFAGKYFKQTANLNMTTVRTYNGMGKAATFAGIYDGCGYTITADITGEDQCVFPYVTGLVMNLMTDGSIANEAQAGGICRSVREGGAVINCASVMTLSSRSSMAGGIASSTQEGNTPVIYNCFFAGSFEPSSDTSPTKGWYESIAGVFGSLYHPDSLKTSNISTQYDQALSADQMENELASKLNDNLAAAANAAKAFRITASDLCKWENASGYPIFIQK